MLNALVSTLANRYVLSKRFKQSALVAESQMKPGREF